MTKTRRTMCAVTKIRITHEHVTPAEDNTEGAVMTALENHRMKLAPLLDALKALGVDITQAGPALESRNLPIAEPSTAHTEHDPEPPMGDG